MPKHHQRHYDDGTPKLTISGIVCTRGANRHELIISGAQVRALEALHKAVLEARAERDAQTNSI